MHQSEQSQHYAGKQLHSINQEHTQKKGPSTNQSTEKKAYNFANRSLICLKTGKMELPQIVGVTRRWQRDQSVELTEQGGKPPEWSQKLGRGLAGKYEIKQLYIYSQLQTGTERAPKQGSGEGKAMVRGRSRPDYGSSGAFFFSFPTFIWIKIIRTEV